MGGGQGQVEAKLSRKNANVSAVHQGGVSALGLVVKKGAEGVALELVRAGADVNMNAGGITPLIVCSDRMPAVKAALLAAGANM